MYQREGNITIKKISLEPTIQLCRALGNPQEHFRSIHIAGTNGKGSVSHMIGAVLSKAEFKTGIYTSPHYIDFRERIKIDGEYISEEDVVSFIEHHEDKWKGRRTSFFELTVGMAFQYFFENNVDYAVIETGLGGRLDSTNVILPELSVITNISMDHAEVLGDNLKAIAGEKAGIIKQGKPVVIGRRHPETDIIFMERAKALNAPIYFADEMFELDLLRTGPFEAVYRVRDLFNANVFELKTDLVPAYQKENIRTALAALKVLSVENRIGFSMQTICSAFENIKPGVKMIGRWDILAEKPLIIADSAHNEDGIKWALSQIGSLEFKNLHIVLGFVKEKDLKNVLSLLPKKALYYFTEANIPRALNANDLRNSGMSFGLQGYSYGSVREALKAAESVADKRDLIMVMGSIFVVAEVY